MRIGYIKVLQKVMPTGCCNKRCSLMFNRYLSLASVTLLLSSSVLFAEVRHCAPFTEKQTEDNAEQLRLSAEDIKINPNRISILEGQVQLEQDRNRIRADRVAVDANSKRLTASGNVRYTNCNVRIPPWFISADELTMDRNKKIGVVKKARLHLGTIPFLYLPHYRINLSKDQRKSGLLSPRLGYNGNSGIEAGGPLYFNIATNKDMTVTPKIHSRRGLEIDMKARYLYELDRGAFGFSWIDDTEYNDERYFYFFEHFAQMSDLFRLNIKVRRVSDADYVEDLAGNLDLLNESYLRSYLESDLFWRGWNFNFKTELLQRTDADADWLQQPYQYQLRPGIAVSRIFTDGPLGMNVEFQSQAAQFVHKYSYNEERDQDIPFGNRFHNSLRMDWLYRRPWFFFIPAATISHTHYKIHRQGSINRTQPVYSLRSGLIFAQSPESERIFRHTIEPTLFYLNVPRREQDKIPLFDTTANEFNFQSLFSENRFNGIDRIGDADQLTLALNSRLLHRNSGKEVLRASVGRIYYFRDRRVRINACADRNQPQSPLIRELKLDLNNNACADRNQPQSPLIGELKLDLNNKVKFLSSWVWDSKQDQTLKFTSKLSLNGSQKRIVNLYYRSQADAFDEQLPPEFGSNQGFEQAGINLGMPLSDAWTMLAGWSYDFDADDSLSSFVGVEYRSCCWTFSLSAQRRLIDVDNESGRLADGGFDYETYIGFEFKLEGLGGLGDNLRQTLGSGIFGYL